MTPSRSTALLLAGDVAALAAFVWLGMRTHATGAQAGSGVRFGLDLLALVVAWLAAGAFTGAFRLTSTSPPWGLLGRTLAAWLLAAPYGLLLRAALLRLATLPVAFVAATLGAGGAMLLLWRVLFIGLSRLRPPAAPAGRPITPLE